MKEELALLQRVELSMLYDFYGALLKENQRQIFEEYRLDDYSLSEITQDMGITRQGVHDALKRTTVRLQGYEDKLGLVRRFQEQKKQMKQVHRQLQELDEQGKIDLSDAPFQQILEELRELLEEEE